MEATRRMAFAPLLDALASDRDAVAYVLTRGIIQLHTLMPSDYEALVMAVPPPGAVHPLIRSRIITQLVFHVSLEGLLPLLEFLMSAFGIPVRNDTTATPLWAAATAGHHEIVEHLLNSAQPPVDLDRRIAGRSTLLNCAVAKGHVRVARVLLGHGADINATPQYDQNFGAAIRRATSAEMVEFCVDNGAFKNCLGFDDGAAVAAIAADAPLLSAYMAHGCDLRRRQSLLPTAVRNKQVENLDLLLEFPIDVDSKDETNGSTALHNALRELEGDDRVAVVTRLIEYGADALAVTFSGQTAVDIVVKQDPPIAELLAGYMEKSKARHS